MKDIIVSGGENISSIEVEKAICAHPAVLECAVIAAPDLEMGRGAGRCRSAQARLAARQGATPLVSRRPHRRIQVAEHRGILRGPFAEDRYGEDLETPIARGLLDREAW
jgi:acyl-CoA synthetase (AMP-forming)/AMP-acid ligase II